MARMTMIEAIRDAMDVKMGLDEDVVVFGEDVGYFGGVFRCTTVCRRSMAKSVALMRRLMKAPLLVLELAWPLTASGPALKFNSPTMFCPPTIKSYRKQRVCGTAQTANSLVQWLSECQLAAAFLVGRRTRKAQRRSSLM